LGAKVAIDHNILELVGGPSFWIFTFVGMVGVTKGKRMREIIKGIGPKAILVNNFVEQKNIFVAHW
jgi:hypothetical protein